MHDHPSEASLPPFHFVAGWEMSLLRRYFNVNVIFFDCILGSVSFIALKDHLVQTAKLVCARLDSAWARR